MPTRKIREKCGLQVPKPPFWSERVVRLPPIASFGVVKPFSLAKGGTCDSSITPIFRFWTKGVVHPPYR